MKALEGLRVLVVDDEALIALHAEDILLENGAIPVGPASTLSEALVSVENPGIDAVLLDVNLNGQSSKPVAERLSAMAIPYIVVTGYGQLDWDGMKPVVLAKPLRREGGMSGAGGCCHRRAPVTGFVAILPELD